MHGGKREGAGRKPLGVTKKVSITLHKDIWDYIEKDKGALTMSAYLRNILLDEVKREDKMRMLDNIIGSVEAAKLTGYSLKTIEDMCASGKITAKKISNVWIIDLERFKEEIPLVIDPQGDFTEALKLIEARGLRGGKRDGSGKTRKKPEE